MKMKKMKKKEKNLQNTSCLTSHVSHLTAHCSSFTSHSSSGITLVALVVTIIVLLILAGVTIATLFGENGIITSAQKASEATKRAQIISSIQLDVLEKELEKSGGDITQADLEEILAKYAKGGADGILKDDDGNIIGIEVEDLSETIPVAELYEGSLANSNDGDEGGDGDGDGDKTGGEEPGETKTPIDKTTSKVSYYADFEGDGIVDGVIYADLAVGGSVQWSGAFSYGAISDVKDYYVSQTAYEGAFGTGDVLTPISSTGNDRFYVMALEDFTNSSYSSFYCYYNASGEAEDETSNDFGKGKANTATMISKWNSSAYGEQNDRDMWGVIQAKVSKGWFVPSNREWFAFASVFGITSSNYEDLNMKSTYWTSRCLRPNIAVTLSFDGEGIGYVISSADENVRLSATF